MLTKKKSIGASAERPLRALVIGAGPAALAMHLPVLARLRDAGRLDLAMICDLNLQRAVAAQRRHGFHEISTDSHGVIERQDFDTVYIFGSAQLHHRCGLMALHSGKHLFVEKPVAPSYAEAMTMVASARSSGTVAVAAHNRRFYESLTKVRRHAGKAGWRAAEAVFHKSEFSRPPPFGAKTWLGANGIHALDALLFMMGGPPVQLWALAGKTGNELPSAFSALMRWRDGAQAVFMCNNNAGSRREEYTFHGLGETFRVSAEGVVRESDQGLERTRHPWIGDGVEAEHHAFLEAIHGEREPPHSLRAIAPSLFIAELIEAGFCGDVRVPAGVNSLDGASAKSSYPLVGSARASIASGSHLAVTSNPELISAIARWLPTMHAMSLDEIYSSPACRPEVVGVILGRGAAAIGSKELEKLPNLAVVGIQGLSLRNHNPQLLIARGIALVNACGAYAESVAEFALGLIILGRRRAFASHETVRKGGWGASTTAPGLRAALRRRARVLRPLIRAIGWEPLAARFWRSTAPAAEILAMRAAISRDLRGASVGLLGWGHSASALTQRLLEAGASVVVYSEHAGAAEISVAGARAVSLRECLAADVVSLHRGLTDRTRHALGAEDLDKLRPGAVLINVARGALIDPEALLSRLRRGDVFACLDTYDQEPLATGHPLRALPNVFLTAHIAGGSVDMHAAAAEEVVRKVSDVLQGAREGAITSQRLSTMT